MPETPFEDDTVEAAGEYLRLSLAKLGKHQLAINPVNYALVYCYLAGTSPALNTKLDQLFDNRDQWTNATAHGLFTRYICQCGDKESDNVREELLLAVTEIFGSLVAVSGKAELSNSSLESHIEKLLSCDDPQAIKSIASDILSESRSFIEDSTEFQSRVAETTDEMVLLKIELDKARQEATIDALTGLNNRRGFDQALHGTLELDLPENRFCLLMVDVDHFKQVNDTYGHVLGDKVLVNLSKVLKAQMRDNDYLSRIGGEEFAIILEETSVAGAIKVSDKLRRTIEKMRLKHSKTDQYIETITISIGIAAFRKGEPAIDLIQRCDKALYQAKSLGRNRVQVAD